MKKIDRVKDKAFPYLMCLPALILFVVFILCPFFTGAYTSFHKWDGYGEMSWVGLDNYGFVLEDEVFWLAMRNTMVYAALVTVAKNILALGLAMLLIRKLPCRTLFRTGIYMPVTMSYVVI